MQILINQSLEKSLEARSPQVSAMQIDQEKYGLLAPPPVHHSASMRA
jgi:hypothetical protein